MSGRPGTRMLVMGSIGTAVVVIAAAVVIVVAARPDGAATAADERQIPSSSTTTTTGSPETTTTRVVERRMLPNGTREVATATAGLADVVVRSEPPPGWDTDLSPVITPDQVLPPRSAQDLDRVPLPSVEVPISGRHVTPTGWVFSNPTTFTPPQALVFGVVERQGDWVQVELPVRPNGTTGWVSAEQVTVSSTTLRVEVSLTDRSLRVVDGDTQVFTAPVAIGRPSTPTPTGSFYVTDIVPSENPTGGYGPVALALNGYSEVMDAFGSENSAAPGDPEAPDAISPVLALHGTNRPASVGNAQSNGCPRLYNEDMVQLAAMVPAGTPVLIWP